MKAFFIILLLVFIAFAIGLAWFATTAPHYTFEDEEEDV